MKCRLRQLVTVSTTSFIGTELPYASSDGFGCCFVSDGTTTCPLANSRWDRYWMPSDRSCCGSGTFPLQSPTMARTKIGGERKRKKLGLRGSKRYRSVLLLPVSAEPACALPAQPYSKFQGCKLQSVTGLPASLDREPGTLCLLLFVA